MPKLAVKPQRFPDVVRQQNADENQREVKEVAVDVLKDQREGAFAPIALARLADGAGGGSAQKAL